MLAGDAIPFSHKQHAVLKRPCVECHTGAEKSESAGFPTAAACQVCHTATTAKGAALERLAALPKDHVIKPVQRVYKVRDFVIFSHARHKSTQLTCKQCHGEVNGMSTVTVAYGVTMKDCVDCHTQFKATQVCNACHELGQ